MTAESIHAKFAELGADIQLEDIESRVNTLTKQFKVPIADAERSIVAYFLRETGVESAAYYAGSGGNLSVSVADLPQADGQWVNLLVKLTDVWDNTHESMSQIGLIGDETGKTKFVMWKNAGLAEMVVGKTYLLENVVTNMYNDKISIGLNKTSVITESDKDIEVSNPTVEYTGVMVKMKNGSGLIKRCPECNRALRSGTCQEHGAVDGINDLRIMAVFDDGMSTQDTIFNLEMTEASWGHSLKYAVVMAAEAFDANVVVEDMGAELVGKYYRVVGNRMDDTMIVNSCEVI